MYQPNQPLLEEANVFSTNVDRGAPAEQQNKKPQPTVPFAALRSDPLVDQASFDELRPIGSETELTLTVAPSLLNLWMTLLQHKQR